MIIPWVSLPWYFLHKKPEAYNLIQNITIWAVAREVYLIPELFRLSSLVAIHPFKQLSPPSQRLREANAQLRLWLSLSSALDLLSSGAQSQFYLSPLHFQISCWAQQVVLPPGLSSRESPTMWPRLSQLWLPVSTSSSCFSIWKFCVKRVGHILHFKDFWHQMYQCQ